MKTRRLYTLKAFSRDNLIGIQSSVVLSRLGFIRVKEVCVGKVTFQAVESSFDELEEGVHYVECPECHKRMLSLETTHFFRVHHMTTEDTVLLKLQKTMHIVHKIQVGIKFLLQRPALENLL